MRIFLFYGNELVNNAPEPNHSPLEPFIHFLSLIFADTYLAERDVIPLVSPTTASPQGCLFVFVIDPTWLPPAAYSTSVSLPSGTNGYSRWDVSHEALCPPPPPPPPPPHDVASNRRREPFRSPRESLMHFIEDIRAGLEPRGLLVTDALTSRLPWARVSKLGDLITLPNLILLTSLRTIDHAVILSLRPLNVPGRVHDVMRRPSIAFFFFTPKT